MKPEEHGCTSTIHMHGIHINPCLFENSKSHINTQQMVKNMGFMGTHVYFFLLESKSMKQLNIAHP